ncbi:MAG: Crp/Fnr family transcriptional regulator [Burkholderiaceae bacterium]|nr:Crp/Fnr family transcriptional regulator [Burkholderiaceae bacterium]
MQGLDATQHQRVRQALIERSVAAGGFVCRKGEAVDYWVGVIDGLVKISIVSLEGKAVTFTGVPPGGWFGEGSMLKDEPRRYDAVALRDSRIAYMPRATFQWLLDTSIAFNRFLLHQLNERLGQFIGTVEIDRLLGPDARVARCLAQLFNPLLYPGVKLRLEISQGEIGYLTGLSRQRVNQALRRLERDGLLKVDYGSVTVLELDRLRQFDD